MLFKLLEPTIRLAYHQEGIEFPVDPGARKFIAGGVNVNSARCNQFGRRRAPQGDSQHEVMFGDFVNHIIAKSLVEGFISLAQSPGLGEEIGLDGRIEQLDALARSIAKEPSWQGAHETVRSYQDLMASLSNRIDSYRAYLSSSLKALPDAIMMSRSHAGEPLSALASSMRELGLIAPDVEVFVHIDQYEELASIRDAAGSGADYRSVVNAMLNRRDSAVSYRIGTRGYAWRSNTRVFGSEATIEPDRDYKLVDLDEKLKNNENPSARYFEPFAKSVFEKRMRIFYRDQRAVGDAVRPDEVFEGTPSPKEKARTLAGSNPEAVLDFETSWTEAQKAGLTKLAEKDPLEAKLAEIWLKQKDRNEVIGPDEKWGKQYWKKERIFLAVLRIAGKRRQRMLYGGMNDALGLSGGNILTFLSLCQHLWDAALQARKPGSHSLELPIRIDVQTIGVFQAARWWLERIESEYGRGLDRSKFVQKLGEVFSKELARDRKMSYPGHTGFSLTKEDLKADPQVEQFLMQNVDYGNLVRRNHTTKLQDRKQRLKFYLNPIYCPQFRIPYTQIKEPLYVDTDDVRTWLTDSGIAGFEPRKPSTLTRSQSRLPLFDEGED